jgi:hypothetical protein
MRLFHRVNTTTKGDSLCQKATQPAFARLSGSKMERFPSHLNV